MDNKTEVWLRHPEIEKIEVSSFGRVRTLDRIVPSSFNRTRLVKGRILKQHVSKSKGYSYVGFRVDGKIVTKSVHRLVAQTFISNPDSLPEVNHRDCDKTNNNVDNLEWVTHEENIAYRDKCGHTAKNNAPKSPVFSLNLKTLEVSHFRSQTEAGRELGVNAGNINNVIFRGRNHTRGYWFVNADDKAVDLTKRKLYYIDKTRLTAADEASAAFASQVLAD